MSLELPMAATAPVRDAGWERAARMAEESNLANVPFSVVLVELSSLSVINERDGFA